MSRDFVGALLQLNAEKGVPREHLILTISDAIESAYRRIPGNEDVRVRIDPERGEMLVTRERLVVAVVEDPLTELTLEEARAIKPDATIGEEIVTEQLDQDGATVGQRGARVQAVVAELAGEKIDVIEWHEDPAVFVAKALSPAQVVAVHIDEEHRIASVIVPEKMLSLAIGREGQNARLAAKMTGWRIDIRSDAQAPEAAAPVAPVAVPAGVADPVPAETPTDADTPATASTAEVTP